MTAFTFTKATKEQAKLRLALFGPSGSGKTFTSLRIASGLGGRIAFIDTERGSGSKYADRFDFDVLDLAEKDIASYCGAIKAANDAGYDVLIIDSLTHAWHDLLDEVENLARAKYRGNTWSAWSEGTPKQRKLVDALLDYSGHVIATMRTKTEWTTSTDGSGKSKPVRVGLAPEQGKGIEYEFDLLMEMSVDHIGNVIKDRTGRYQDQIIDKPDESLGQELAAWLRDAPPPQREPKQPDPAPDPQPAQPKLTRPYDPEILRKGIRRRIEQHAGDSDSTPKQQQLLASKLSECFAGEPDADNKRHSVMAYLVGKTSTKELTFGEASVLLDWLVDPATVPQSYDLNDHVAAEAHGVLRLALVEAGQEELLL